MSSILKSLKTYNDRPFKLLDHPTKKMDLENKVTYVYGLGLIMGADDEYHESEKKFIGTLLRTLDLPDELLEDVEQNSRTMDEEFIEQLKNTLTKNNLVDAFFYDALMICFQDGSYCQTEQAVLKQLCHLLGFNDKQLDLVERTVNAIDSINKFEIASLEGECYWNWEHLLEYSGIEYFPEYFKVSNDKDLHDLIIVHKRKQVCTFERIMLGEGDFYLSEDDFYNLSINDARLEITGLGKNNTTVWLEGKKNNYFVSDILESSDKQFLDEYPSFAYSHCLYTGWGGVDSISNCNVRTSHSNLLVVKTSGSDIFYGCKLDSVFEMNEFDKYRIEHEFELMLIKSDVVDIDSEYVTLYRED
ncbi:TerB family tellurite resistance protein [Vibrio vulnificus]